MDEKNGELIFMERRKSYENKKVLVLGLAKSGYMAAQLLHKLGAEVTVNDAQDLSNHPDALALMELGISVISGGHPDDLLEADFDLLVKNPGIPYSNSILIQAKAKGIPIVTEVEIATSVMQAHIIGLTGTNGKTTTTSMIQSFLSNDRNKGRALALGNIGVPASQMALEVTSEDDVILELSSFQLMGTPTIKPEIALMLNLSSAHLDYHGSQEAYEDAKMNLIRQQGPEDVVIYNKDQKHLEKLVLENTKAQLLPFSRREYLKEGISVKDESIYFKGEKVADVSEIFLHGLHNLENFLAAIGVAKLKGVSNGTIHKVLQNFKGVKHRTQYLTEHAGRIFYNDSKATNIEATQNALAGFKQPVVLLAGGLDREISYEALIPSFSKHVKAIVAFGETAASIKEVAEKAGVSNVQVVENVEEAVPVAYQLSEPGDVILLSPASASWDQYPSFEIRGERYIEAVENLIAREKGEVFKG